MNASPLLSSIRHRFQRCLGEGRKLRSTNRLDGNFRRKSVVCGHVSRGRNSPGRRGSSLVLILLNIAKASTDDSVRLFSPWQLRDVLSAEIACILP